jgi:hypothetical protein
MLVQQKVVRNPHNNAEGEKKRISWPLMSTQSFLAQLLVFFANICYMSDHQNVLTLKVVRKPAKLR